LFSKSKRISHKNFIQIHLKPSFTMTELVEQYQSEISNSKEVTILVDQYVNHPHSQDVFTSVQENILPNFETHPSLFFYELFKIKERGGEIDLSEVLDVFNKNFGLKLRQSNQIVQDKFSDLMSLVNEFISKMESKKPKTTKTRTVVSKITQSAATGVQEVRNQAQKVMKRLGPKVKVE